jgi:hypothetical protein
MKKTAFTIAAFIALLSMGCGSKDNTDKRRYELVCSPYTMNNNTFVGMRVLDTYTGDVWGYTGPHHDQDSNWTYVGNPTKLNLK